MNLPDRLRYIAVVAYTPNGMLDAYDEHNIEDELAALVEAADAGDQEAYMRARAALVAKIGGKG